MQLQLHERIRVLGAGIKPAVMVAAGDIKHIHLLLPVELEKPEEICLSVAAAVPGKGAAGKQRPEELQHIPCHYIPLIGTTHVGLAGSRPEITYTTLSSWSCAMARRPMSRWPQCRGFAAIG